jgi:3-oxoadipate enol-lactonase
MMETLVEDVRTLLVELGIPSVHFIGLSLGGMIGQLLAATYPAMISALVLCDTSCRTDATAGSMWDERIAVARMRGMEPHVEPTIARWFTPHFVAEHPEVVDSVREMIRRTDPKGYMGCGHAVKTFDAADLLCCIKAPTLVLVGEDDPGTPVDAAREIKDRISSSQLVVLPSASHLSNLEQPEAFNRAVAAFLQSVDEQV